MKSIRQWEKFHFSYFVTLCIKLLAHSNNIVCFLFFFFATRYHKSQEGKANEASRFIPNLPLFCKTLLPPSSPTKKILWPPLPRGHDLPLSNMNIWVHLGLWAGLWHGQRIFEKVSPPALFMMRPSLRSRPAWHIHFQIVCRKIHYSVLLCWRLLGHV